VDEYKKLVEQVKAVWGLVAIAFTVGMYIAGLHYADKANREHTGRVDAKTDITRKMLELHLGRSNKDHDTIINLKAKHGDK
jgi:hypothetical protein